jgi:hypothetical protein
VITRVPQAVKALAPGERRLAWGVAVDDTPLVATPTALHAGELRVPWTSVEKAVFQPPVLTVREVAEVEGTGARHDWELAQDVRLAEVVRAQVTSSVGWSDRRRLPTKGALRVVGRRVPGEDALLWQVVFIEGADPDDPLNRAEAAELVASLRATLG